MVQQKQTFVLTTYVFMQESAVAAKAASHTLMHLRA